MNISLLLAPREPLRPATGMAMLETLVALLLFSLSLLGLLAMQARAIDTASDAEDRNRAALLADQIASAMWMAKSTAINAAPWSALVATRLSNGTLAIAQGNPANANARITITWAPPSRSASDTPHTLTTEVTLP